MNSVLILGGGMVGSVMALDMCRSGWRVTIADARNEAIERTRELCTRAGGDAGESVRGVKDNLADRAVVRRLAAEHDLVLGALSSHIAYEAMLGVIEAKRNYCDIAFMPQAATDADVLAKRAGVTCVTDCGVAPGMSHMLAQACADAFDVCERLAIYVGGLPAVRSWPWQYKAAFSPADVIEEYTRPSRLIRGGKVVSVEAMSEPELIDLPGAGTLEAFNTDGLRSLVTTLADRVPEMVEKTMRYPGHIELMRVLRAAGMFSEEPVTVGGVTVRPRDLLAKLLFPQWTYAPGEEDLTVMRVTATGQRGGARRTVTWDLFDRYDRATNCTSMARTTALPCTIIGRAIALGRLTLPGLHPPEIVARQAGMLEHVLSEQRARGVVYTRS